MVHLRRTPPPPSLPQIDLDRYGIDTPACATISKTFVSSKRFDGVFLFIYFFWEI